MPGLSQKRIIFLVPFRPLIMEGISLCSDFVTGRKDAVGCYGGLATWAFLYWRVQALEDGGVAKYLGNDIPIDLKTLAVIVSPFPTLQDLPPSPPVDQLPCDRCCPSHTRVCLIHLCSLMPTRIPRPWSGGPGTLTIFWGDSLVESPGSLLCST